MWQSGDAYDVERTDYLWESAMGRKKLNPVHPGEILLEEFLNPTGISQHRVSRDIHVPARRINKIIHGKRAITADTALRQSRYSGMSERFWINLQTQYDLEVQKDALESRLEDEVKVFERTA